MAGSIREWNKPLRLGIMISGRGSNMQAIVHNIEAGELAAEVALVVCNRPDAAGLQWARDHGLPTALFDRCHYRSRASHNAAMAEQMVAHGVELVVMAGFDRLITRELFDAFRGRIVNVHPSLLPAFAGTMHAQAEAFEYGVKIAGCTVHFVTEDAVDGGPIILQAAVPALEDDTKDSLAARILEQEHIIFSRALRLYVEGRLRVVGHRVRILEAPEGGIDESHY
jgi:phosphoribosylglycinamide formyltransferase-1